MAWRIITIFWWICIQNFDLRCVTTKKNVKLILTTKDYTCKFVYKQIMLNMLYFVVIFNVLPDSQIHNTRTSRFSCIISPVWTWLVRLTSNLNCHDNEYSTVLDKNITGEYRIKLDDSLVYRIVTRKVISVIQKFNKFYFVQTFLVDGQMTSVFQEARNNR